MKSIIFGAGGQDGRILAKQIESIGGQVLRITRTDPGNPSSADGLHHLFRKEMPDRIYYLAAHHRSSEEAPDSLADEWIQSFQTHLEGWVRVLEGAKTCCPGAKLLYASSAYVFGIPVQIPQAEMTPLQPNCAYGWSKLAGMEAGRFYREQGQLSVSHVILFPHESIFRDPGFLSKKLLLAAQSASQNPKHQIEIGDPEATCDWGYASEFTFAMQKVLDLENPEDLVIATGYEATVADFAKSIFDRFGLNWRNHVVAKPGLLTKPKRRYVGDSTRLFQKTGFRPKIHLPELGRRLADDFLSLS